MRSLEFFEYLVREPVGQAHATSSKSSSPEMVPLHIDKFYVSYEVTALLGLFTQVP